MGLAPDSFRLFEDKQKIAFTARRGPSPCHSSSIPAPAKKKMDRSVEAEQVFKTVAPEDECFLIQFADRPAAQTGHDQKQFERNSFVEPAGWTALNVYHLPRHSADKAAKNGAVRPQRRATTTAATDSEVRSLVRESVCGSIPSAL